MNKVINPKFESYDVMTEWGLEGVSNWWAKDIEVYIRDMQNEGGVLQNYEVGEVFSLLVCSPDFKRRPNSEFTADDLSKALVLDRYDKDEVKAYLKKRLTLLVLLTWRCLIRSFAHYLICLIGIKLLVKLTNNLYYEHMSESHASLSVIRIFEQIRSNIAEINTSPLTPETIKINKDEFAKLGDDEIETGVPFARIAIDFPESNSEFTFCIDFFSTGVVLSMLGLEPSWCEYSALGDSNRQVAQAITNVLKCLASGQLALLATSTEDDERLQAFELLYRKPGSRKYDAICTATMFESKRKLKGREYTTDLFINRADIAEVPLDIAHAQHLLLFDADPDLMQKIGRKHITDLHVPLTRELFDESIDRYAKAQGAKALDAYDHMLGTPEMSLRERVFHFAKWRHIELMYWALALLLCPYLATWNAKAIHFAAPLLAVVVTVIFLVRNKLPYPKILFLLAPVGYLVFFVSAFIFVDNFINHWLSWVIGVGALVSLSENVYVDVQTIAAADRKKVAQD